VIVVIAVLSLAILRPWATVGESDSLPITMGALLNAHGPDATAHGSAWRGWN